MSTPESKILSDELLAPCPFCGSSNIGKNYVETFSTDSSYSTFGCLDCGANFHESDGGLEEWNKRTNSRLASVEAELAAIKALPVAVIGPAFQILWTRQIPLEGLRVGDSLYALPPKE